MTNQQILNEIHQQLLDCVSTILDSKMKIPLSTRITILALLQYKKYIKERMAKCKKKIKI